MRRRLRVLRIIARLNVGGPARHVTVLDQRLGGRGFQTLLAHGEVGPDEASLERLVHEAGIPSARIPGLGRRVSPVSDLRALAALVRLVFRYQPDVVHTHTAKAGTLGRIAATLFNLSRPRSARCLVVHTFHGHVLHDYFGRFATAAVRAVERALGRVTDCVLVLSPRQRDEIAGRYRVVPPARAHVVPLGLELDALLAMDPATRPARTGVVFGFVGRFVPIKNLPMLIEAFASVHRRLPDVRLLLVGDGASRADIESLIARLGLQDAVELAGWRQDLPGVYRDIDVVVLASLNEGTPVAVIEAMAAGLPVIATDVGGVADVVEHGVSGVLVPSGSLDQLTAAMLRLAGGPGERTALGCAGRAAVRTRFTAERLAADVAQLYAIELERKRVGHGADASAATARP
jgi:glycosyltransferase involved in cell wall biosynthesis